jgi:hypothetical protein
LSDLKKNLNFLGRFRKHTREINKILSTKMDVLRRSARKSRIEKIKNEYIKERMGVKEKPDIIQGGREVTVHRPIFPNPAVSLFVVEPY